MLLPKKFGHYIVHSELGRGGMAIVYKCWEEALNRFVAIKVLNSHLAEDKDVTKRFFREAKSMAAISHPNIINVYYIGEEQGLPYFAMEYIEGLSLSEILENNRVINVEHAKNIIYQACEGLHAAHQTGLIHRDIKPGNILIDKNGFLKLLDFGIAQSKKFNATLTQTGELIGTPGYLSPEICTGQIADKRSDIYSMGIVFYQMLAGDVPFDTSTPYKLIKDIVESDISEIQKINKKVDDKTADTLLKMIQKNPQLRFQSCQQVLDQLGSVKKNSDCKTIIGQSTTNQNAQETTRLRSQLTNHRSPTIIRSKKNWTRLLMISSLLFMTFIGYYFLSNNSTHEINETIATTFESNQFDLVESIDNQQQTADVKISEEIQDDIYSLDKMPDLDTEMNKIEEVLIVERCLEVASVNLLAQQPNKWSLKKQQTPPASLLKEIRRQLVEYFLKESHLTQRFEAIAYQCSPEMDSYKLSLLVTSYKKDSKLKKYISKVGLGKEKITLILTVIDLNTNKSLANKEIELKDISDQIESNNDQWIQVILSFLKKAIK